MAFEKGKGRGAPRGGFGGGRSTGGAPRPYTKGGSRDGADRPARPYTPRAPRAEGSEGRSYDRPKRDFGDRPARPYTPRAPRAEGSEGRSYDRPKRDFGDRPARPYTPRAPRGEGAEGRSFDRPKRDFGDRPARPYTPRAPRAEGSEGRSFDRPKRDFGDRPARPYTPRAPRAEGSEGRSYDRPKRDFGDRPARPYTPRAPRGEGAEGRSFDRPKRDFADRPERNYGEGPAARFDAKREIRRDRKDKDERSAYLAQQDGWLVGHHAVVSALQIGRRSVRSVWLMGEAKGDLAAVLAQHPEWPVEVKAKPDFDTQFGDMVHQGVAALVGNLPQPSLPELLSAQPQVVVALDHVTDPHNLGAVVRSCAAFGAGGVIVTEDRAAGITPTVAKAAAGALETVPVVDVVNLAQSIRMMQEKGYTVVGLAGEAEDTLTSAAFQKAISGPVCIVMGSEGDGLRRLTRETCDMLVKIDISSAIESLNVSVAAGVVLAHVRQAKA